MADNEKGLKKLLENVADYFDERIGIVECLENHQHICYNELDDHINYFSDGRTRDITMNLFKLVVKAQLFGDEKALSRLRVDLGIDYCNLTIVPVKE